MLSEEFCSIVECFCKKKVEFFFREKGTLNQKSDNLVLTEGMAPEYQEFVLKMREFDLNLGTNLLWF